LVKENTTISLLCTVDEHLVGLSFSLLLIEFKKFQVHLLMNACSNFYHTCIS
jgi:hypothetical protein